MSNLEICGSLINTLQADNFQLSVVTPTHTVRSQNYHRLLSTIIEAPGECMLRVAKSGKQLFNIHLDYARNRPDCYCGVSYTRATPAGEAACEAIQPIIEQLLHRE